MPMTADCYADFEGYGETSEGLGIPDPAVHRARLSLAASMIVSLDLDRVLDIGCGFGELSDYLDADTYYLGVDITPWIVRTATLRRPDRSFMLNDGAAFLADPRNNDFDVVAALGVLTTVDPHALDGFLTLLRRAARRFVLVSWQGEGLYTGAFQSYSLHRLTGALGEPVACSLAPGDTEFTGLFHAAR